ncbi:MAG: hypothetical protein WAL15_25880, partial [Xanthobacteraceae bacterium]
RGELNVFRLEDLGRLLSVCHTNKRRHGRACPGHPRLTFVQRLKTWMPAQASLRSLRKLGCERGHDAECVAQRN